jgi:uncharacterized protein YdeI (YjbR/CyaY-like superfamily)
MHPVRDFHGRLERLQQEISYSDRSVTHFARRVFELPMATELDLLEVGSRREWRAWLVKHHTSSPGIWLVFHKAHTAVNSIAHEDAVREALCFGWIDSLIKRLDEHRYALKVTPRKPGSKWSDLNRTRWKELKAAGLLTSAGLAAAPNGNSYGRKRGSDASANRSPYWLRDRSSA